MDNSPGQSSALHLRFTTFSGKDSWRKVYPNAMQVELIQRGLRCQTESRIQVHYKIVVVGDYSAGLFVDAVVIVELKVAKTYKSADEAPLLIELKTTGIKVAS